MGTIRKDLKVISFAIPSKLKQHLEKLAMIKGFSISDFLREIVLDYIDGKIPVEDLMEIIVEINKIKSRKKDYKF